jgi:hypothetical protein
MIAECLCEHADLIVPQCIGCELVGGRVARLQHHRHAHDGLHHQAIFQHEYLTDNEQSQQHDQDFVLAMAGHQARLPRVNSLERVQKLLPTLDGTFNRLRGREASDQRSGGILPGVQNLRRLPAANEFCGGEQEKEKPKHGAPDGHALRDIGGKGLGKHGRPSAAGFVLRQATAFMVNKILLGVALRL